MCRILLKRPVHCKARLRVYFTAKGGITKSLCLVSGGNRVGCTQEENEPQGPKCLLRRYSSPVSYWWVSVTKTLKWKCCSAELASLAGRGSSVLHLTRAVVCVVMSLQANLKAESATKTLLQRCQDLVKIIEEYPAKVAAAAAPPAPPTAAKTNVMWGAYIERTGKEWNGS